jgi:hypothetical protein
MLAPPFEHPATEAAALREGSGPSSTTPSEGRAGRLALLLRSDALCLALAFLPVLASATWKAFIRPRPFWAFFYDPESFYFHDGLRLLHGEAPLDVTHPGTPVQALSALLALSTGATGATPEGFDRFRAAAYCLAWGLQLLGAVVLLRTVLARVPMPLRVVALLTYFLSAKSLEYETVWSPEIVFFAVGALAIAAVWRAAGRDFDFRSSVATGAAIGLACAVKLLFLPWLLAAGVTAAASGRSWMRRGRALAGIALGAALGFAVGTLPAAARYPDMLTWMGRLASRSGRYGDSPRALPSPSLLSSNLATLVEGGKGWYLWVLLAAVGAWLAVRTTESEDVGRRLRRLTIFAVTAIVLGHLVVLRAAADPHYLLPAAVATVGLAAVAAHAPLLARRAGLGWAMLFVGTALLGKHALADARTHLARVAMAERSRASLAAAVARHAPADRPTVVVYGYGTPMPSLALRYFATDPELLHRIETRYPGEGHLGPRDHLVLPADATSWDVMVLAVRDRRRYPPAAAASLVDHVGSWDVIAPAGQRPREAPR